MIIFVNILFIKLKKIRKYVTEIHQNDYLF